MPRPVTAPEGSSRQWKLKVDGDVVKKCKERFRKMDTSRNGLVEKDELAAMLPDLKEFYVDALFKRLDRDQSGSISFDEFVEYVFTSTDFHGKGSVDEGLVGGGKNGLPAVEQLKEDHLEELEEPMVRGVEIAGATLFQQLSGSMVRQVGQFNEYPSYEWSESRKRVVDGVELFFGRTSSDKFGWFLAAEKPAYWESGFLGDQHPDMSLPVGAYVMFNPSPLAESPNLCRAMWVTPEGDRDKRMFCADTDLPLVESRAPVPAKHLEEDELWGETCEAPDADWRQGDWEDEWHEQPGEALQFEDDCDSDEDNDHRRARQEVQKSKNSNRKQQNKEAKQAAASAASETKRHRRRGGGPRLHTEQRLDERTQSFHNLDHLAGAQGQQRDAGKAKAGYPAQGKVDPKEWKTYQDGLFVDKDFPPCGRSLGAQIAEVQGWKRLSSIHQSPCLFHRIVPDDVFPPAFAGNLWLLSACAAVAEYPAWIQSMFGRRTCLSSSGRYVVRLFHPGKMCFVRVVIDDYVPVSGGSPFFTGVTSAGEIWVALVEKAFAKLCGSYAKTEWGFNAWGLHYICGGGGAASWKRHGPSRWRRARTEWNGGSENVLSRNTAEGFNAMGDWRDEEEVWAMLRMSMERCYPVACAVEKGKATDAVRLLSDRMYSLIAAREVPVEDGSRLRMLLLRNPFGVGEHCGRWSDDDSAWQLNPDVREALQQSPRDDGLFWMSYAHFLEYFDWIDIVRKSMPIQGSCPAKMVGFKRGLLKSRSM